MLTYAQTTEREFLQARYLVLELAAVLDRLQEAAARDGTPVAAIPAQLTSDPKLQCLLHSLRLLTPNLPTPNRAEQILNIYAGVPAPNDQ